MTTGNSGQAFLEVAEAASSPTVKVGQAFLETIAARPTTTAGTAGQAFLEVILSANEPPPTPVYSTPAPVRPKSMHRWRGNVGLNWLGLCLIGDAFSNVVGLADYNTFTEYGNQMQFRITTPPINSDRKRVFITRFEIMVEGGQGMADNGLTDEPVMMLSVSKDGGKTWLTLQRWRSMGKVGDYTVRLRWINLGQARDWVFALECTDPVRRAILGCYHDSYVGLG